MSLILSIDNVETTTALLFVTQLLGSIKVRHGRFLGVANGRIDNRFYFIFGCKYSLLSCFYGDSMRAWSASFLFPHMQDIDYGLRLFVNSGGSALLISRPEFNLLSSGSAKSQFFKSISVDSLLLGILLLLLFVSVFVEHAGIVRVSIIDPEDSMSPATLYDPIPLAEEYLLGFELTELLKLGLDLLELLPSLPGHPDFSRVYH